MKPDFENEEVREWDEPFEGCLIGEDCTGGQVASESQEDPVEEKTKPMIENSKSGFTMEDAVLGGGVIMPKLENATAK